MNCGLIGYPLGHSYSPQIHRALADYDYHLWSLKPEELEAFLVKRDFAGINVTIPYKERVIPYLDQLSDTARAIDAVNTVVNRDGKLYGDNTDLAGMLALIRRMGLVLSGKKVLILGTGGTSKTARAAASQLGAAEVCRVSRGGREDAITYRQAAEEHGDAACIINTTPCGMYPDLGGCPVELDGFPRLEGVVDVIYNPLRSELVLSARQRGIPAEGGLYMLAAQAAYASALFRGCEATAGDIELAYRTVLRQMENIVLIGMPSSGKTTVGRLLAQRTGKEFVDTDALVDAIQQAYFDGVEGIILNPAAYTHTSVALLDALKAVAIPAVEVHISDVAAREDFRQISYVRPACIATVTGRGFAGYLDAMDILLKGAAES